MSNHCPSCSRPNEPHARFCSNCGRPLPGACTGKIACGGFPTGLVIVGVIVWFTMGRGCPTSGLVKAWPDWLRHESPQLVQQTFGMPSAKADAMYELLSPSDVKVIVGRSNGGVVVKGTSAEVGVVKDFVELVTRLKSGEGKSVDESVRELRGTWTARRTYELPRRQAQALLRVLAFDDVPVLVHGYPSRVIVDATEADQKVLADVVSILWGKRL